MPSDLKYIHTPDMGEISGFGGGYEEACQKLLDAGVKWSISHKDKELLISSPRGTYGLISYMNDAAKSLEEAMLATGVEPTGAMMHCVTERVFHIHHNDWDWYCKEMREYQAKSPEERGEAKFYDESEDLTQPMEVDDNLIETLKGVFGSENVVVLDSPEAFDKLGLPIPPSLKKPS